MKIIQKDISSEAKDIYEALAETNIQSALEQRAFIGDNEISEIKDKRDRAAALYKKSGTDTAYVKNKIDQVNLRIEKIMAYKITTNEWSKKYEQMYAEKPDQWRIFTNKMNAATDAATDARSLYVSIKRIFNEENIEKTGSEELEKLRAFVEDDKIID